MMRTMAGATVSVTSVSGQERENRMATYTAMSTVLWSTDTSAALTTHFA